MSGFEREVAIVGGGLAGAALALRLARAGRDVVLFERSSGPHDKVCGEFLSAGAVGALAALGLSPAALGAVPITRMALHAERGGMETALPFAAAGLSRRCLDEALLRAAAGAGAEIRRGVAVRAARAGLVEADRPVRARRVVVASGKHELRGLGRMHPARGALAWTGLKLHLALSPAAVRALAGTVRVELFAGGYAGLQLVGGADPNTAGGLANLCLAATDPALARAGRDLLPMLAARTPGLAALLDGAAPCWPRPIAVARVPYGHLHRDDGDGLYRLGDQFAAIPSFCGDGMAIALLSAERAAAAIVANEDAAAYHRRLRAALAPQFRRAAWLARTARSATGRRLFVLGGRFLPGLARWAARATRSPPVGPPVDPGAGPAVNGS